MIKLIEYTEDFKLFDSNKSYLKSKYKILIKHDNSKEDISNKFRINFLDNDNNEINFLDVNSWTIQEINIENYYGRAMVSISIKDPNGTSLPRFESGGFSLGIDEERNINSISDTISEKLLKVLEYSFYQNYRLKLDFDNLKKRTKNHI